MKRIFKFKKTIAIVVGVIAILISYNVGQAAQDDVYSTQIDNEIYDYNKLVKRYKQMEGWIKEEEAELDDKKAEVKEVKKAMKNRDKLNKEIKDLTSQAGDKQTEIEDLDSMISSRQEELDKLTAGVKAKKEEPIQLNAGQYIVGHDVKEGRYKATNIGRGTNFIVYGDDGSAVVNTILGTSNGSGDYVFFATDGEIIQTEGQAKLIPVE